MGAFPNGKTSYATALDTRWQPNSNDTLVFKLTVDVRNDPAVMNLNLTGIPFTWEVRS